MDGWPPDPRRHHHKRSTPEMSHQAILTPSPVLLRGSASSSFHSPAPSFNSNAFSFQSRRISHPHNAPMERSQRPSMDGSERGRPRPPPRLEHRASQTLTIDLTDESDEPPPPSEDHHNRRRQLRITDIIDLTDDPDVEITRVAPRHISPNGMHHRMGGVLPPINIQGRFVQYSMRHANNHILDEPAVQARLGFHSPLIYRTADGSLRGVFEPPDFLGALADQLNNPQQLNQGAQKPDHVPPEPAKEGFTRSPTEKDVVICPSCERELVHNKEPEEPVVKKGGKAPTRKEREEHPFWVVKACGHVYCNHCYQNRLPSKNQPKSVHFPEKGPVGKGAKGIPLCSVEDCESDVKNKDKWVGVFL